MKLRENGATEVLFLGKGSGEVCQVMLCLMRLAKHFKE